MALSDFIEKASLAYYEGHPIITDFEFDRLSDLVGWDSVGHKVSGGIGHPFRMYSLNKVYAGEDEIPLGTYDLVETVKLDGAAVSLIYINGYLEVMLTRGNGKIGQDVSHLIPGLTGVPTSIETEEEVVQITGEIVAPKSIPNARNYAAGSLNLKELIQFQTRPLDFIAYGVQPYIGTTYMQDMRLLSDFGFLTVFEYDLSKYPTDGLVFRVNSNEEFEKLGFTSQYPKGAFALKTRHSGVVTTLLDVIWQVGRTGRVSPVAILEPVVIGEATVSRATLHNIAFIRQLGLEIGCKVEVVRSGEIIPAVVAKVS